MHGRLSHLLFNALTVGAVIRTLLHCHVQLTIKFTQFPVPAQQGVAKLLESIVLLAVLAKV